MKKAIFLCKHKDKFESVYIERIIKKIGVLCELDTRRYTKEDVLASPEDFADVQVIFSTWGMPSFEKEEIEKIFPNLECVFYAAGTVQKFARPFLECGVKIFSAWAANAVPVAEYTIAQIILANKGFFTHSRLMNEKRLDEAHALTKIYRGNYDEQIGLIGCGMIGSLVAKMLGSYKLGVLVYDPFLSDEKAETLGVKKVPLEELFKTCRVVSNHLANNDATKGILQYSHFASMLPYATFINTGRGAQVVEEDLVKALEEREDLTALLDVTYPEPAALDHKFYTLPNCILTPHIAGSLGSEVVRMSEYMAEEFRKYLAGEHTRYEVSMKMLETMA